MYSLIVHSEVPDKLDHVHFELSRKRIWTYGKNCLGCLIEKSI